MKKVRSSVHDFSTNLHASTLKVGKKSWLSKTSPAEHAGVEGVQLAADAVELLVAVVGRAQHQPRHQRHDRADLADRRIGRLGPGIEVDAEIEGDDVMPPQLRNEHDVARLDEGL